MSFSEDQLQHWLVCWHYVQRVKAELIQMTKLSRTFAPSSVLILN